MAVAEQLRRWLFEAALPLWWRIGADHTLGGYYERIDFEGRPVMLPRRSRVAARLRSISCANDLQQDDGTVISTVDQDGSVLDATFDLYNQAFALLAYACGHGSLDPNGGWQSRAYALVGTLKRNFAQPAGGFCEDRDGRLPLRANPHMHLLEAALAWLAVDPNLVWRGIADEIVALCLDRFIDRDTAALRELFASDWTPASGRPGEVVEPGHHYEWAFLLDRWSKLTGRDRPAEVPKLIVFADSKGLDRKRRVAINGVKLDGSRAALATD